MRRLGVCGLDAIQFGGLGRFGQPAHMGLQLLEEFPLFDNDSVDRVVLTFDVREVGFEAHEPLFHFFLN